MKIKIILILLCISVNMQCVNQDKSIKDTREALANNSNNVQKMKQLFYWENAQVYFLLTDRFYNADISNDVNFGRTEKTSTLRGFQGGDIKGITKQIKDGYFNKLGVDAIWLSPIVEQIHGLVNEGSGATYGYHGYWTKDWTAFDPNFGTAQDFQELVDVAHENGIRLLLDAVINHTGPTTESDPVWPSEWVRTEPKCTYKDFESSVKCTLVKNLPDIKTEDNEPVKLPPSLVKKWKKEGRYGKEISELESFFRRTGYPRAPRFYIIKWLTDLVRKYGIDGFRVDTVKHTEETVWKELRKEAEAAHREWKQKNPNKIVDESEFYMVGEVYGYSIHGKRLYDFGDRKIDYFDNGFNGLINFSFKEDAKLGYEKLFSTYSDYLQKDLKGKTVLNYISSHDDGGPFDKERKNPIDAATKLLLCPGSVQTYYGDETARKLRIDGANGDANLRSFMNWEELTANVGREAYSIKEVHEHWKKLGKFRQLHPSVGLGVHKMLSEKPYTFSRHFTKDKYEDAVIVALNIKEKVKEITVSSIFADGTELRDYYSLQKATVKGGKIRFESDFDIVLIGL